MHVTFCDTERFAMQNLYQHSQPRLSCSIAGTVLTSRHFQWLAQIDHKYFICINYILDHATSRKNNDGWFQVSIPSYWELLLFEIPQCTNEDLFWPTMYNMTRNNKYHIFINLSMTFIKSKSSLNDVVSDLKGMWICLKYFYTFISKFVSDLDMRWTVLESRWIFIN